MFKNFSGVSYSGSKISLLFGFCAMYSFYKLYIDNQSLSVTELCTVLLYFTFSVRINERKQRGMANNKKIAYLVDLKTIAISMFVFNSCICYSWSFSVPRGVP